jgi:hypothetical protein
MKKMISANWKAYSKKGCELKMGILIEVVPAGMVPDKAALKKKGHNVNGIKNCEKSTGREAASYLFKDLSNNRLCWPLNRFINQKDLRKLRKLSL